MSSTKSKSASPVKLTEAKTLLKAVAELKRAYAVSEKTGKLSTKQIDALPVWAAKETVSKTVSKSLLSLGKKADAIKAAKAAKASTPAKKEKKVAAVEKKLKDAAKKFGATLEKKEKALEKKIKKIEASIQKKKEKALAKKAKESAKKKAKKSASSKKSPNAKKARKSKKAVDSFATPMSFWGGNSNSASLSVYDDEM